MVQITGETGADATLRISEAGHLDPVRQKGTYDAQEQILKDSEERPALFYGSGQFGYVMRRRDRH